ncbi:MAG TPA: hypothetical protein ENJ00_00650 [Phycisphaerales bacterium]|nr:hypothetical protein [Phycisphaerales bacterium]
MYTHLALFGAVAVAFSAHAQPYEIVSSTIDGGGGAIAGSTYEITGSIGQSDAGPALSGITYELAGGFVATLESPAGRLCADQNNDGLITPTDFTAWIGNYNTNNLVADVNQDGSVTPTDFTAWIGAFNLGLNGPICSFR